MMETGDRIVLNQREIVENIKNEVKNEVEKLIIMPKLAIIKIGSNLTSVEAIKEKVKACEYVGIKAQVINLQEDITEIDVLNIIKRFNRDTETHGILVQLPLPKHLDAKKIINTIDVKKDVECFHDINMGGFYSGSYVIEPCMPAAIIEILKRYSINLEGKKASVIGRCEMLGKPIAQMLINENCTVTICHSKTLPKVLEDIICNSDIIINTVHKSELISKHRISSNQLIIDLCEKRNDENKLIGDIYLEDQINKLPISIFKLDEIVSITIAMLMKNCIKCAKELIYNQ